MDVEQVNSRSREARSAPPVAGGIARLDGAGFELALMQRSVDRLRARMSRPGPETTALPRLAAMLQACGAARPGTLAFAAALARTALEQRCGRLELPPPPPSPRVSVVLSVPSIDACFATLRAAARLLGPAGAEVLLCDEGLELESGVLVAALRHLRVIGGGEDGVAICNLAVAASRAPNIVLLGGGALEAWPEPEPGEILVGRRAVDCLARFGVLLGRPQIPANGLLLAASRSLWGAVGGLDPEMEDGNGLALADFCLKARLLGARLTPVLGEVSPASGQVSPGRAWQAVAGFRARWGEMRLESAAA